MSKYAYIVLFPVLIINGQLNLKHKIDMELLNYGFHRDMHYTIEFTNSDNSEDYDYIIEQEFSPAMYINTDQLDDLKRLSKLHAIYPPFVDVEVPTEKAQSFSVFLYGPAKGLQNIFIPVHFRYHEPRVDNSFVKVDIPSPRLYLRCKDPLRHNIQVGSCFNGTHFHRKTHDDDDCNWIAMKTKSSYGTALSTHIPVGDRRYYMTAIIFTIVCSWVGCVSVIFAINRKITVLNKKHH